MSSSCTTRSASTSCTVSWAMSRGPRSPSRGKSFAIHSRSTKDASHWRRPWHTWSISSPRAGRSASRTATLPSAKRSLAERGSPPLPPVVVREEVANSVTHGLGLLASLVGAFVLVSLSLERGEAWHVVSAAIYGITLVALYAASTMYHALKGTKARGILRVLDHCAIYLLIAGTYTPVALVGLRGGWGWTLFGLAWGFAAAGIVFKVLAPGRFAILSTAAYVLMGWLCIVAAKPMFVLLSPRALALLAAGGVLYTAGVVFYHSKRIPYSHAVWHLFVVAGSVCHYLAITLYVLVSAG